MISCNVFLLKSVYTIRFAFLQNNDGGKTSKVLPPRAELGIVSNAGQSEYIYGRVTSFIFVLGLRERRFCDHVRGNHSIPR